MRRALLERERELAEIGRLVEAALAGSGGLLVVESAAGVGKSTLLEEASRLACTAGAEVLRARGVALEDQFAFGVVRQLFEPVLAAAPTAERRELLSGAAALAGKVFGFVDAGEQPRPALDASFANLHGLYWLCFILSARKPLFLVVDDAHWADAPSLRFASFLAARLEGLPVVLALALRAGEHGIGAHMLEAIRNHPGAHVLRPVELSERACERLIEDAFGRTSTPAFSRACFEVTGGNPFYLRALVDGMTAEGVLPDAESAEVVRGQVPGAAVRSLLLQLSRLPAAASALVRAVAMLGSDAELRYAAALAGLEVLEAAQAADLLATAGILASGRPLRFIHQIVEAAIYSQLPGAERDLMHGEAARILAASGAAAERSASHLLASEPTNDPWSVKVLRAAARDAVARGAPESALSYLNRAQREGPDRGLTPTLLRELGIAELLARRPASSRHLSEALAMTADPRQRAMIAQQLAHAFAFADSWQEAVSVLDRAIEDLANADTGLAQALEAQVLGAASLLLSTRPAHREHFAHVRAQALGDSPPERMLLAQLALGLCSEGERASVVRDLAERALGGGRLLTEVGSEAHTFSCATNALLCSDALEPARYWLDRALADAHARGSLIGFAFASCFRAEVQWRMGKLDAAEADARAALEAGGVDRWVLAPHVLSVLTRVLIERGELTEARALLARCDIPFGMDQSGMTIPLPFARGQLALAVGDWRGAADQFFACGEWYTAWGERNPGLHDWRTGAALALAQLGELDRARALSGEVIELSRYLGQPRCLGIGLRADGIITGGSEGVDLLCQAAATLGQTPAKLEHARALVDLGSALRRLNHRKEAREPLRQGTHLAQRCGATVLAQHGQAELIATGARLTQMAARGTHALTPSERRVAGLAAEGLSTPEIAQQLFVTVNTVETHLRHAYMKLDIHAREQLPDALAAA